MMRIWKRERDNLGTDSPNLRSSIRAGYCGGWKPEDGGELGNFSSSLANGMFNAHEYA